MAYKGYTVNPPPAAVYTYPTQGQGNHTVIVQQRPNVVVRPSGGLLSSIGKNIDDFGKSVSRDIDSAVNSAINDLSKPFQVTTPAQMMRGLFGQLGHELNQLGRTISREVDWTADQINKSLAQTATGNVLGLFQSGNVIQLVSRSSGRSLEIVQGPASLVVDGLGQDGAPNVGWTIVNEGANQIRLHNNNNFLTIVNGNTQLITMPPGVMHGIETKFQLTQQGQFIILESMKERGRHVGILGNGQLKPALATGKENHSMFGVRVLYSPYGVPSK